MYYISRDPEMSVTDLPAEVRHILGKRRILRARNHAHTMHMIIVYFNAADDTFIPNTEPQGAESSATETSATHTSSCPACI